MPPPPHGFSAALPGPLGSCTQRRRFRRHAANAAPDRGVSPLVLVNDKPRVYRAASSFAWRSRIPLIADRISCSLCRGRKGWVSAPRSLADALTATVSTAMPNSSAEHPDRDTALVRHVNGRGDDEHRTHRSPGPRRPESQGVLGIRPPGLRMRGWPGQHGESGARRRRATGPGVLAPARVWVLGDQLPPTRMAQTAPKAAARPPDIASNSSSPAMPSRRASSCSSPANGRKPPRKTTSRVRSPASINSRT